MKPYKRIIWAAWIVVIYVSTLSNNSYYNYGKVSMILKRMAIVVPQGWGFFTRNTDEKLVDLYKIQNGTLQKVFLNNTASKNYFGLSKNNRLLDHEKALIVSKLPDSLWLENDNRFFEPQKLNVFKIEKKLYSLKRQQIYMLKRYQQIPFIWARAQKAENAPFDYIIFKIE